jgi:hypothetical protein
MDRNGGSGINEGTGETFHRQYWLLFPMTVNDCGERRRYVGD